MKRTIYTYSTRVGPKKTEEIGIDEIVWKLSLIRGCIDYDRCNERRDPHGSCDDCLEDSKRIIKECSEQGIKITVDKL